MYLAVFRSSYIVTFRSFFSYMLCFLNKYNVFGRVTLWDSVQQESGILLEVFLPADIFIFLCCFKLCVCIPIPSTETFNNCSIKHTVLHVINTPSLYAICTVQCHKYLFVMKINLVQPEKRGVESGINRTVFNHIPSTMFFSVILKGPRCVN
jgi:hypothetical protein